MIKQKIRRMNILLEEIDTVTLCARTGVEIWYFHPDQIMAENESPSLIKLKHDRG